MHGMLGVTQTPPGLSVGAPSFSGGSVGAPSFSPSSGTRTTFSRNWQDAVFQLQDEQQQVRSDLDSRSSEATVLANEITKLREQLEREKAETSVAISQYTRKIETLGQENNRLQMKLMRSQQKESTKDSEAATIKREVLEKTSAIEKVMRDFQQREHAMLSRVNALTQDMQAKCSLLQDRPGSPVSSLGSRAIAPAVVLTNDIPQGLVASASATGAAVLSNGYSPAFETASMSGPKPPITSGALHYMQLNREALRSGNDTADGDTQKWFQSVKSNLEYFGEVEVFNSSIVQDCACCMEQINTQYRIRPKKCSHVFHVECLLQWWTEGTCPVCGVSFAPDVVRTQAPNRRHEFHASSQSEFSASSRIPHALNGSTSAVRLRGSTSSVGSPIGRRRTASRSVSPILTRPAGLPGPGSFGGGSGTFGGGSSATAVKQLLGTPSHTLRAPSPNSEASWRMPMQS